MNATAGQTNDRVSRLDILPNNDVVKGNAANGCPRQVESAAILNTSNHLFELGNLSTRNTDSSKFSSAMEALAKCVEYLRL